MRSETRRRKVERKTQNLYLEFVFKFCNEEKKIRIFLVCIASTHLYCRLRSVALVDFVTSTDAHSSLSRIPPPPLSVTARSWLSSVRVIFGSGGPRWAILIKFAFTPLLIDAFAFENASNRCCSCCCCHSTAASLLCLRFVQSVANIGFEFVDRLCANALNSRVRHICKVVESDASTHRSQFYRNLEKSKTRRSEKEKKKMSNAAPNVDLC